MFVHLTNVFSKFACPPSARNCVRVGLCLQPAAHGQRLGPGLAQAARAEVSFGFRGGGGVAPKESNPYMPLRGIHV